MLQLLIASIQACTDATLYEPTDGTECVDAVTCTNTDGRLTYEDTEKLCLADKAACIAKNGYVLDKACLTEAQCNGKDGYETKDDHTCVEKAACLADQYFYTADGSTQCLSAADCIKDNGYTFDESDVKECVTAEQCTAKGDYEVTEDNKCVKKVTPPKCADDEALNKKTNKCVIPNDDSDCKRRTKVGDVMECMADDVCKGDLKLMDDGSGHTCVSTCSTEKFEEDENTKELRCVEDCAHWWYRAEDGLCKE